MAQGMKQGLKLAGQEEIGKFAKQWFAIVGLACALAFGQKAQAQTATVTWTTTHQTIDGWGGEDWSSAENLTSAQAAMFFSPQSGIGLSIIRTQNYGCPSTGGCEISTNNVPDLVTLQEAVSNGAQVELGISPPANLKYDAVFADGTAGANGTCIPNSNWSPLATFTVQWIEMLETNGIPVSVVSVSNEPDAPSPKKNSLGGCYWTASALDGYIGGYLGPALVAAGLSTKIMAPEEGFWFGGATGDLFSTCLNDAACNPYVSIVAMHGYGSNGLPDGFGTGYCCATPTAAPASANGKHIWQSEINGGFTYNGAAGLWNWDPSVADAMVWARNIHDFLTVANLNGWEYWQLADCCPNESGAPFNDGLTKADLTTTSVRMFVIGNWSKFVRPGWVRIDTTSNPQPGIYVTAFKNPAGTKFAIVVLNANQGATSETFALSQFPGAGSLIPWLTDGNSDLAAQSSIEVNGNSFSYSLPAQSVTTFVGTTDNSNAGNSVTPPTSLKVSVR